MGEFSILPNLKKKTCIITFPLPIPPLFCLAQAHPLPKLPWRLLSQAGVLVGFCGGGGTPLFMGSEIDWLTPQSEYRPTKYVQGWLSWWWDDAKRLTVAKKLQIARLNFLQMVWQRDKDFKSYGFDGQNEPIISLLNTYQQHIMAQNDVNHLLTLEGRMTKELYKFASINTNNMGFRREYAGIDKANVFLNHGNYLAYGLGATTAWVLGIPHGFAVMHGKTRRGALVFDIADIVKDAIVLPLAFICAQDNTSEQEFRQECLNYFTTYQALDMMFDTIKDLALKTDWNDVSEQGMISCL